MCMQKACDGSCGQCQGSYRASKVHQITPCAPTKAEHAGSILEAAEFEDAAGILGNLFTRLGAMSWKTCRDARTIVV